jgi:dockerin type I repeat protein
VSNVTLSLTGNASGSTLSDGSGNYQFSSLPSGGSYTVTPTKAALPPGSTGINTVDVVATQRHFLIIGTPLTGCRLTAADVNGDSAVNTVDIVAIQRFFLVLSTGTATVGKYQFTPTSRSYSGIVGDQTAQNYDTLIFGDIAAPYVH